MRQDYALHNLKRDLVVTPQEIMPDWLEERMKSIG